MCGMRRYAAIHSNCVCVWVTKHVFSIVVHKVSEMPRTQTHAPHNQIVFTWRVLPKTFIWLSATNDAMIFTYFFSFVSHFINLIYFVGVFYLPISQMQRRTAAASSIHLNNKRIFSWFATIWSSATLHPCACNELSKSQRVKCVKQYLHSGEHLSHGTITFIYRHLLLLFTYEFYIYSKQQKNCEIKSAKRKKEKS